METTGLRIYLFDIAAIGGLGDSAESTWQVLQQVPLSSSAYTITEDLLLSYDWSQQTITIPNTWGSSSLDAPGLLWSGEGAFLVTFNDQRLFGGRVVQAISPRRFDYPAMALTVASAMNEPATAGKLIYSFHPQSSVFYAPQPEFLAADPAIATAVHDHLAQIGKLQ